MKEVVIYRLKRINQGSEWLRNMPQDIEPLHVTVRGLQSGRSSPRSFLCAAMSPYSNRMLGEHFYHVITKVAHYQIPNHLAAP